MACFGYCCDCWLKRRVFIQTAAAVAFDRLHASKQRVRLRCEPCMLLRLNSRGAGSRRRQTKQLAAVASELVDAAEPTRLPGWQRTGGSGRASVNPSTASAAAAAGRSCCFVHVFICNSLDFTASCLCVSRLFKHHVGVEEFTGPVLPTRFPDTHRRKHSCVCTRYKLAACLSVCLSGWRAGWNRRWTLSWRDPSRGDARKWVRLWAACELIWTHQAAGTALSSPPTTTSS